jgi:hypothetical protein
MLRQVIVLLLAFVAAPAKRSEGIRAIYERGLAPAAEMNVSSDGDIAATIWDGRRLIVRTGEAFIVEDRLTGPIVTRLSDLEEIAEKKRPSRPTEAAGKAVELVSAGKAVVGGREGEAFELAGREDTEGKPDLVLSSDPALARLGQASRQLIAAELILNRLEQDWPETAFVSEAALLRLLEQGAPLRFSGGELDRVEPFSDASAFQLPAEPESRDALEARLAAEQRDQQDPKAPDADVLRAAYFQGQLWLLSDSGKVWSIAEAGGTETVHPLGKVADLCLGARGPVALVQSDESWTVHRWSGGAWRTDRSIGRGGDTLSALSCEGEQEIILTSRRILDLKPGRRPIRLNEQLKLPAVRSVVHARPDALYVGLNSGEWGGGLRRIDRRTGGIRIIERNATGELCGGPLNTNCDPIHGVATIPWKPDCVAAAVGLHHMSSHGRIAQICGDRVETLFTQIADRLTRNPKKIAEAAEGDDGAVAFFGLAATDNALLAAGDDGLYRLDGSGKVTYRPWPRFHRIGAVLVSFEDPDAALVISLINGRASVGWAAPLMAPR